jgi:hypothetical protein
MLSLPKEEKWKMICTHEHVTDEQENSFKIKGAPEYFIHSLRENQTIENLQNLQKALKEKDENWVKKLLDLGGLTAIFEVLVGHAEDQKSVDDMKKLEEEDEKKNEEILKQGKVEEEKETKGEDKEDAKSSFYNNVQSECLIIVRILMNTKSGMNAFIVSDKSREMIARSLDSNSEKTKTQVFFLLSTVCVYSEEGFWLSLDVVNNFKTLKREKQRFETIVSIIKKTKLDTDERKILVTSAILFVNTLVSSVQDRRTKKLLKNEFKELELLKIVEELKTNPNITDKISIQLGVFEEEMDYGEEDFDDEEEDQGDIDSLDNPLEILKLIRIQLSGTDAFEHFIAILQYFLIVAGKSNQKEKVENMQVLEGIVKKAINMGEDGSVHESNSLVF